MPTLVEVFVDNLDGDLAKRRREISDLRLMVLASAGDRLSLIARACHVISYAHWEGFVRASLRRYLALILNQHAALDSLQLGLQALALQKAMRVVSGDDGTVIEVAQFIRRIDNRAAEEFLIDPDDAIQMSNLTSKKFKGLLSCVGLEFLPQYELRENYIDEVLCGRRHRIAHGIWQPVSADEAREAAGSVLELCSEFNDQIQTAAVYEEYRR